MTEVLPQANFGHQERHLKVTDQNIVAFQFEMDKTLLSEMKSVK